MASYPSYLCPDRCHFLYQNFTPGSPKPLRSPSPNSPKLPDTPGSLLDTKNRWFCFSIIVAGPPKSMVLFQYYVRRTPQSIVLFQYYCRWTRHIDGFVSLFCSPDPLHRWFCFSIMFAGPPKSMVLFQYYRFFSPGRSRPPAPTGPGA